MLSQCRKSQDKDGLDSERKEHTLKGYENEPRATVLYTLEFQEESCCWDILFPGAFSGVFQYSKDT